MAEKRFIIFLNGDYGSDRAAFYRELCAGGVVIAADAAIGALKGFAITADVLIGDFDSAPEAPGDHRGESEVIIHSSEKDETDGELAVQLALERGADELVLCGYRGDQTDHALGNLLLLALARRQKPEMAPDAVSAVSEGERIWFVDSEQLKLTGLPGSTVSIVPLDRRIVASLRGFRFDIERTELLRGSTRPLRNELAGGEAEIALEGAGFVVQHQGV